ncbi:MAG: glycosyltransferase [Candidatus Bathyarchaeota archaeon]|nr:glycosyltransferase [Mycoplasmatota bacterium]MDG6222386.1 glycosyltransferase [Candidatus Bathyarchaeum tardum]WNZ29243.1 MAG: glycosyltransferase [Candidatus Bathyarchaeota archaeon]
MKVTIGVCVKNCEEHVKNAIDSIVAQDYNHDFMELIVVDGYSKDKTLQIINKILKNVCFSYRIFCENEGLGHARQIVVDNSHADYIVWVDGDMILSKDFVSTQVEFMDNNPEVGIGKGKYSLNKGSDSETLVAMLENAEFLLNTLNEGESNSKCLGTSGCIYRVKAIKQVGGFDLSIKGVGEDMDAENRVRQSGWLLYTTNAKFYETRRQTWNSLWHEYFWHGQGNRYLFKKNNNVINLYKLIPPVAIFLELLRVPKAYKLLYRKSVVLLPLHYLFKRIAWIIGFLI